MLSLGVAAAAPVDTADATDPWDDTVRTTLVCAESTGTAAATADFADVTGTSTRMASL